MEGERGLVARRSRGRTYTRVVLAIGVSEKLAWGTQLILDPLPRFTQWAICFGVFRCGCCKSMGYEVPPSILASGFGSVWTACSSRRWKSRPPWFELRRLKRKVNSSR